MAAPSHHRDRHLEPRGAGETGVGGEQRGAEAAGEQDLEGVAQAEVGA